MNVSSQPLTVRTHEYIIHWLLTVQQVYLAQLGKRYGIAWIDWRPVPIIVLTVVTKDWEPLGFGSAITKDKFVIMLVAGIRLRKKHLKMYLVFFNETLNNTRV